MNGQASRSDHRGAGAAPGPQRSRWQFSLKWMLLITLVAACLLSAVTWDLRQKRRRADAEEMAYRLSLTQLVAEVVPGLEHAGGGGSGGSWAWVRCNECFWEAPASAEIPDDVLHRLEQATVERLTSLGAKVYEVNQLGGVRYFGEYRAYGPNTSGVQIIYSYRGARGAIVFRLTEFDWEPFLQGQRYSAYLWHYHVQFR